MLKKLFATALANCLVTKNKVYELPLVEDPLWPRSGFPLTRCKLTLAGGAIEAKVSFLARP